MMAESKRAPSKVRLRSGAPTMAWAWRGPDGWGEMSFYLDEDGQWHCDAEGCDPAFVKEVIGCWLETVVFDQGGD